MLKWSPPTFQDSNVFGITHSHPSMTSRPRQIPRLERTTDEKQTRRHLSSPTVHVPGPGSPLSPESPSARFREAATATLPARSSWTQRLPSSPSATSPSKKLKTALFTSPRPQRQSRPLRITGRSPRRRCSSRSSRPRLSPSTRQCSSSRSGRPTATASKEQGSGFSLFPTAAGSHSMRRTFSNHACFSLSTDPGQFQISWIQSLDFEA